MIYTVETPLSYFEFWGGAKLNAAKLTDEELEELDALLPSMLEDTPSETLVNDIFWFEFEETICPLLNLEVDDKGDIIREQNDIINDIKE